MDLVTVTFSIDKEHVYRQAVSINKFVTTRSTHWVIIDDDALSLQEWQTYLSPLYINHELRIIPNTAKVNFNAPYHAGWIIQQILKFTISKYIKSDYYLILDSKNFFCKETNLNEWPVTEGNGFAVTAEHSEYNKWLPFSKIVATDLNRSVTPIVWNPLTPFKVKTATIKQILKDFDIESMFQTKDPNPSEFILYSYYADVEKYKHEVPPFVTIFDSPTEITSQLLDSIDHSVNIKMFGIHRDYNNVISIPIVNHWLDQLGIGPHFTLTN